MDQNLELVFKISNLHTKMIKSLDSQLSIHGITFSEFYTMYQLSITPTKTMRRIDLAQKVGMSASGVTRLLAPMEKLGIVQKQSSPRDARVSFVNLTTTGEKVLDNALKTTSFVARELFEDLYSFDIAKFLEVLKKI